MYDISFTDRNNKQAFVHQTSCGVSTRMIGALIMVHIDDKCIVCGKPAKHLVVLGIQY